MLKQEGLQLAEEASFRDIPKEVTYGGQNVYIYIYKYASGDAHAFLLTVFLLFCIRRLFRDVVWLGVGRLLQEMPTRFNLFETTVTMKES